MSKDLLICIGDGDNIGDVIDFYLLSNDLENASKFSFRVKVALERIAVQAQQQMEAHLVYVAGDDICFLVSSKYNVLEYLSVYSNQFFELTGKTISFGMGKNSAEASFCLRKAKVSGKGKVISFGE